MNIYDIEVINFDIVEIQIKGKTTNNEDLLITHYIKSIEVEDKEELRAHTDTRVVLGGKGVENQLHTILIRKDELTLLSGDYPTILDYEYDNGKYTFDIPNKLYSIIFGEEVIQYRICDVKIPNILENIPIKLSSSYYRQCILSNIFVIGIINPNK